MRLSMADIIFLDKKMQLTKEKQAALIKKRKIMAVRNVFHCTHCPSKCEKCGIQIGLGQDTGEGKRYKLRVPYHFCKSCSEEYVDYIEHLNGKGDPDCYWYNDAWLELWRTWIDYQGTIDRYLKSKEFLQLLMELKSSGPES